MSMREKIHARLISGHTDYEVWHPNVQAELIDTVLDSLMEPTEGMCVAMDDHAGTIAPEFAYISAIQAAKDGK